MRPLRATLTIACASVGFATGAQAQDAATAGRPSGVDRSEWTDVKGKRFSQLSRDCYECILDRRRGLSC
jgi:hypothetical protein